MRMPNTNELWQLWHVPTFQPAEASGLTPRHWVIRMRKFLRQVQGHLLESHTYWAAAYLVNLHHRFGT